MTKRTTYPISAIESQMRHAILSMVHARIISNEDKKARLEALRVLWVMIRKSEAVYDKAYVDYKQRCYVICTIQKDDLNGRRKSVVISVPMSFDIHETEVSDWGIEKIIELREFVRELIKIGESIHASSHTPPLTN